MDKILCVSLKSFSPSVIPDNRSPMNCDMKTRGRLYKKVIKVNYD